MTTDGVTTMRSKGRIREVSSCAVEVGSEVGRYVVLGELGQGGTGVVLRAYDPELEREVALKILSAWGGEDQGDLRAAVLSEARTLAKLRHHNVVGVYDIGEHEDRIWMAMELVRGRSLRRWAAAQERSSSEVRRALVEAGTGLMAAHEAGIVHCDVKPENVMVADRAYIVDFGLAHGIGTRDGSVSAPNGTWPYLAPELYDGSPASFATDVYAFCVMAWEMLLGSQPWSASNEKDVLREKRDGPKLPARAGLSRALAASLRAGLSPDSAARPDTLAPIVASLKRGPRTRRRFAVGVGLGAVALAWGLGQESRCAPPMDVSPFDDASTAAIRASLEEGGPADADVRWGVIQSNLDAFRDEYARQYRHACEAAPNDFERARRCLDRRRDQLAVLVEALSAADVEGIREAPRSIAQLSSALHCERPDDISGRVAEVFQVKLDRAEVLELLSRFEDATALASSVEADAQAAGDRPGELWARYRRGRLLHHRGEATEAASLLSTVHWDAEAEDLPGLASAAGLYVLWLHAAVFDDPAAALGWAPHVTAAVHRAGDDQIERASLVESTGIAKLYDNRASEAYEDFVTALALRESAPGDVELHVVSSLGNLGVALEELGRYDEAIEAQSRALEILERRLGPNHPHTARAVDNLGTARLRDGEVDVAQALFERALQARRAAFGDGHRSTALSWVHVGMARLQGGQTAEALEAFRTALPIVEALDAPGTLRSTCLEGLAHAHAARQEWPQAHVRAGEALESLPASMPEAHPERRALRDILASGGT